MSCFDNLEAFWRAAHGGRLHSDRAHSDPRKVVFCTAGRKPWAFSPTSFDELHLRRTGGTACQPVSHDEHAGSVGVRGRLLGARARNDDWILSAAAEPPLEAARRNTEVPHAVVLFDPQSSGARAHRNVSGLGCP